ncbi:GlxA family transcriptional regulator [Dictyobacter kobayashii]|uniref:AraC family transcriptional regulator n=1 Tax=Dictyobacter kobayashii TaxID=2014872 RepID=A0A402AS92_9CHLR|nr:GlxA family transcriptional regulator [Dictyobacter kobayashii]GCE21967.1 AraC family transcriptional regulator [Dictyobacter kobayashii]
MPVFDSFLTTIQHAGVLKTREQRVLFLVLPQVNLLDLAGPAQVFDAAARLGMPYRLIFCAHRPEVCSAQGLSFAHLQPLEPIQPDDLVIVPGLKLGSEKSRRGFWDPSIIHWLRQAYDGGSPIASVCTGAFALGEAGLLDGRRCTTHWASLAALQEHYPRARVLDSALFVQDRRVTTSAGIASGIDMALSLLEQRHGPLFTAQVARYLVVYVRRNGSQSQDSIYLQYRTHLDPAVHQAQDYLINHITGSISLQTLADTVHLSVRSLTRSFKEATGLTPVQYHQRLQLELATTFLHDPGLSIEEVAHKCGFEDARHFRRLWQRTFGVPPSVSRSIHNIS